MEIALEYKIERILARVTPQLSNKIVKKLLKNHSLDLASSYERALINTYSEDKNLFIIIKLLKCDQSGFIKVNDYELFLLLKEILKVHNNKKIKIFYKEKFIINFLRNKLLNLAIKIISKLSIENKIPKIKYLFLTPEKKHYKYFKKIFFKKKYILTYLHDFDFKKILFSSKFHFNKKEIVKENILHNYYLLKKIILLSYKLRLTFDFLNPDKIICCEGDSPVHSIMAEISKKKDKSSICLQWGAFVYKKPKPGFKNLNYKKILVWGNFYKSEFLKINKKSIVSITGTPLISENNNRAKKDIVFFLGPISKVSKSEDIFISILKWIQINYTSKIILRSHPSDPDSAKRFQEYITSKKVVIHDSNKFSLNESIKNSIISITVRSSASLEASRCGVIPFIISNEKNDYENFYEELKRKEMFLIGDDIRIIKENLIKIINNDEYRKKLSLKICKISTNNIKYTGKKASEKIINEII